ncbi:hypothetical protein [Qipengyuania nanhaisediminis]|uniref:hypothetical protein n=1 Tax=Qipengyuania nanhaisediminis TaxID=604088 RepID=UPI0038B3AE83
MVKARAHVEAVLTDRAIHGVEEAVFYHGEEVARRRRYDSRLLLALLARLDRIAEAVEDPARGAGAEDGVVDDGASSGREARSGEGGDPGEVPDLETRLCAMEAARPDGARALPTGDSADEAEMLQLLAYESGVEDWWTVIGKRDLPATLIEKIDRWRAD